MLLNHPAVLEVHRDSVGLILEVDYQIINDALGYEEQNLSLCWLQMPNIPLEDDGRAEPQLGR